jgi:hypothetical protein
MDKRHSGRAKDVLFLVFFIVVVLLLVWVFTAEVPEGNYYAYVFGYGNTITMVDRAAGELYEVKAPGVYLMNKEGELVGPIQGGLKMVFAGLIGGGGREFEVGLRGIRVGLRLDPIGITVLIILPLLLISLMGYRFIRSRRPVGNGE